jgi:hypothetical protein
VELGDVAAVVVSCALDVERRDADWHITFGFGMHFCLGAPRRELPSLFGYLVPRLRSVELADEPATMTTTLNVASWAVHSPSEGPTRDRQTSERGAAHSSPSWTDARRRPSSTVACPAATSTSNEHVDRPSC